jgi:hypothetical protein
MRGIPHLSIGRGFISVWTATKKGLEVEEFMDLRFNGLMV